MLVIQRNSGQSLVVDHKWTIKVARISEGRVTLVIDAPKEIVINRNEIEDKWRKERETT